MRPCEMRAALSTCLEVSEQGSRVWKPCLWEAQSVRLKPPQACLQASWQHAVMVAAGAALALWRRSPAIRAAFFIQSAESLGHWAVQQQVHGSLHPHQPHGA